MTLPFPRLRLLAAALAVAAACTSVSDTGGTAGGPTVSQQTELLLASQDELESLLPALTVLAPAIPPGSTHPTGCPSSSPSSDVDSDSIPDDQTRSHANPPCLLGGVRGGTLGVTGTLLIQDPNFANNTSFNLTLTDLVWDFTDPAGSRSYTATRNGTRNRLGAPTAAALTTVMTTVRARPNRAAATITLSTTATFTATAGDSIRVDQPLPSGTLLLAGSFGWQRSTEDWSLTLSTPVPLQYDATCAGPQRISAGQLYLSGSVNGQNGTLVLIWTSCGLDPARTWVAGP